MPKIWMLSVVAIATGCTAAMAADDLLPPETRLTVEARVTPGTLAKDEPTPVSAVVRARLANADGSPPVPMREVTLETDRHLSPRFKGVPPCRYNPLIQTEVPLERVCRSSLLATGRLKVLVAFPETEPMAVSGTLHAYRLFSKGEGFHLLLVARLGSPVNGAILVRMKGTPLHESRYGFRFSGMVPKIAGGNGSITYLGLRFKRGTFVATCPDGHLQTRLSTQLNDGTVLVGATLLTCTSNTM